MSDRPELFGLSGDTHDLDPVGDILAERGLVDRAVEALIMSSGCIVANSLERPSS